MKSITTMQDLLSKLVRELGSLRVVDKGGGPSVTNSLSTVSSDLSNLDEVADKAHDIAGKGKKKLNIFITVTKTDASQKWGFGLNAAQEVCDLNLTFTPPGRKCIAKLATAEHGWLKHRSPGT